MVMSSKLTQYYFEIISGTRKGIGASLLRCGLFLAAYGIWTPMSKLDKFVKSSRSYHPHCPVICVGNITAGGTGKTPMVRWLYEYLIGLGEHPVVLTNAYHAKEGELNDESEMLRAEKDSFHVLSGKNRSKLARKVDLQNIADVIILDDGFQHLRLERDLDIVLIDCLRPFGYGHPLPRGLLRESIKALLRANIVVLTRADQVDADKKRKIRQRILSVADNIVFAEAVHQPVNFRQINRSDCNLSLDIVDKKKVVLFSAIGNPLGFETTINYLGADVLHHFKYRDHYRYDAGDLEQIRSFADEIGADYIITTEKDIVKIGQWAGEIPLYALKIQFNVVEGEDELLDVLSDLFTVTREKEVAGA